MKPKKINPLHLDQQLCFDLYSASRLVTQAYDPYLKKLSLTYPQYLVMLVLWESDNISVKDIGQLLKLDSGTLSPLLKKLESRGYVKKTRLEVDERIVVVELTTQGRDLRKQAGDVPSAVFCKVSLQEKDIMQLRQQLHSIIKCLEAS